MKLQTVLNKKLVINFCTELIVLTYRIYKLVQDFNDKSFFFILPRSCTVLIITKYNTIGRYWLKTKIYIHVGK